MRHARPGALPTSSTITLTSIPFTRGSGSELIAGNRAGRTASPPPRRLAGRLGLSGDRSEVRQLRALHRFADQVDRPELEVRDVKAGEVVLPRCAGSNCS